MKIKTMRQIPTRSAMPARKKDGREQTVNRMAQLEHEKARLERELQLWREKEQRTAERLQQVETQLHQVQQTLGLNQGDAAAPEPQRPAPAKPKTNDGDSWNVISLEY
ncbi:MAG: hypothetical protein MUD01_04895 [Chloroflexaceae bacterium]|nr:hypothetical protein [Chloroflexaceae bacterium]